MGGITKKSLTDRKLVEINTEFLYPGAILKGDTYTLKGEKLLDAFHPVTNEILSELRLRDIKTVYYEKPGIQVKNDEDHPGMVPFSLIEKAFNVAEEIETAILKRSPLPKREIEETVESIIEKVTMTGMDTILHLIDLRNFDEYTYTHSVNAAMLAILFAKQMLWNQEQMRLLGVGMMLHDMGKLLVPKAVLNKREKLTPDDWALIKKHVVYGYEILKNQSDYPESVCQIPLLHHERNDGNGYVQKLRGEQIPEFVAVAAICDCFDAITSKRSYKLEMPLWYAFLYIHQNSGKQFVPRYAAAFVNGMPRRVTERELFPAGLYVKLTSGEIARIISTANHNLFRPTVDLMIDPHGEPLRYPVPVDLSRESKREIEAVVEDRKLLELLDEIRGVKPAIKAEGKW